MFWRILCLVLKYRLFVLVRPNMISTLPKNVREVFTTSFFLSCVSGAWGWSTRTRLPLTKQNDNDQPQGFFSAWLSRVNASGLSQEAEPAGAFSKMALYLYNSFSSWLHLYPYFRFARFLLQTSPPLSQLLITEDTVKGFSDFSPWPLPIKEDLSLLWKNFLSRLQSRFKWLELWVVEIKDPI